jgi:hypothetical protein
MYALLVKEVFDVSSDRHLEREKQKKYFYIKKVFLKNLE